MSGDLRACGHELGSTRWCTDCDEAEQRVPHQARGRMLLDVTGLSDEQIEDFRAHIRGLTEEKEAYLMPRGRGWTCFHCGETFMTPGGARLHFGATPVAPPVCIASALLSALAVEAETNPTRTGEE